MDAGSYSSTISVSNTVSDVEVVNNSVRHCGSQRATALSLSMRTSYSFSSFFFSRQGLLNELVAAKMVLYSAFKNEPVMTFGGAPAVSPDKEKWHYYGNS